MSTSPFAPLQEELRSLLFVDGGRTYQTGLSIIQGMLGISMVLITASLWLRLRGGEKAWLFRVQRTPAGVWIRPHYVYSALIFSLIFIILDIACIHSLRKYAFVDNRDRRDAILFRSLVFIPIWIGGWMLAWSTTLEGLLSRPSNENRFDLNRFPILVNSFFIAIPTIFIGTLVTLTLIADSRWKTALATYDQLSTTLEIAAAGLAAPAIRDVAALQTLRSTLRNQFSATTFWWQRAIGVLAFFVLVLTVTFAAGSLTYFINLRRSIDSIRSLQNPGLDSSKRLANLGKIYSSLVVTTTSVLIVGICSCIAAVILTVNIPTISSNPMLAEKLTLFTFSIYAIGGFIINAGLLFRSVALLNAKKTPTSIFTSSTQKSSTAFAATPIELGKFEASIRNGNTVYISPGHKQNLDGGVELHVRR